ncbi:MAG: NFACT family protein [Deltaproteobacteria bacterium]
MEKRTVQRHQCGGTIEPLLHRKALREVRSHVMSVRSMSLEVLQEVARELNHVLKGGFVNKVYQPLSREIVLRVRVAGAGEKRIMISADPLMGRVHLTDLKIPNPPRPPRFCAFLRAHLQGARITGVTCAPDDRVFCIGTVRGPRESALERDLVLELLGRDSNILVIDRASDLIMECLHRIPEKETGKRVVLPGCRYLPPPKPQGQHHPVDHGSEDREKVPGICTEPDGRRSLTLSARQPRDEVFSSMNEAAEALFAPAQKSVLLEGYRRDLSARVKARIHSLERRIKKIEEDIERSRKLSARQEEGELLKANLGRVKRGMQDIVVQDWETGSDRAIILDPALNAVGNMEWIFKKAAKGKRGEKISRQRLAATLEEKSALQELLFFIEDAQDVTELNSLAQELPESRGGAKSPILPGKQRDRTPVAPLFHEFRSPSGGVILVGKSGKGNNFLLREKARKGDLWFHVKGMAGAHVLLPVRTKEAPRVEDKERAAALAVHFSRARGGGKAEVMVADVKDVTRPKGAEPGRVSVKSYVTIYSEGSDLGETIERSSKSGGIARTLICRSLF